MAKPADQDREGEGEASAHAMSHRGEHFMPIGQPLGSRVIVYSDRGKMATSTALAAAKLMEPSTVTGCSFSPAAR